MKRVSIFALAALMAFGLASCSKDGESTVNPDGVAALSFSFETPQPAYMTYAGEIATPAEWAINSLDAYVFDDAGVYKGKLTAADYTKSVADKTTTITMNKAWIDANVAKSVYFTS